MMSRSKLAGNASRERNRLFIEANAAWDRGALRRAFELFLRAAQMGDKSSQLDLGYFFDQGLSVKKNMKQALRWYHRAYSQGDACGANNIATVYRDMGQVKRMLWWYRRAAAMGHPDVLLDLGKRYEAGVQVPRDPAKASLFYRRVIASKLTTRDAKAEARDGLARLSKRGD
jgi:TPR repeat protein